MVNIYQAQSEPKLHVIELQLQPAEIQKTSWARARTEEL